MKERFRIKSPLSYRDEVLGPGRARPTSQDVLRTNYRRQKDHINIRILQSSISGIPVILGLRTRM